MGTIEITALLVIVVGAFAWVIAKFLQAPAPHAESAARADTLAAGVGYGTEQMDAVRHGHRKE